MKKKFWGILSEERVESFFEKGRLKHENTVDDLRQKLRLALTQHSSLYTLCLYPEAKTPFSLFLFSFFEKFFFFNIFSFYFNYYYYYIYGFTFVMPWWFSRAFFTFNSCSRIIGFCVFHFSGRVDGAPKAYTDTQVQIFSKSESNHFFFIPSINRSNLPKLINMCI